MKTNLMKPTGRVEGLEMERTRILKQKLNIGRVRGPRRRRVVGRDEILDLLSKSRSRRYSREVV